MHALQGVRGPGVCAARLRRPGVAYKGDPTRSCEHRAAALGERRGEQRGERYERPTQYGRRSRRDGASSWRELTVDLEGKENVAIAYYYSNDLAYYLAQLADDPWHVVPKGEVRDADA
jgi:hypothetical protein